MHGEYSLKYLLSTVLKILANLRPELIIKKEKKTQARFSTCSLYTILLAILITHITVAARTLMSS